MEKLVQAVELDQATVVEFMGNPPFAQNPGDAGHDLVAAKDTEIVNGGEVTMVCTGTWIALPETHFAMLVVRSSLGAKFGIGMANDVGIIDSGYRGEIKAALQMRDSSRKYHRIAAGERIVQLVILPVPVVQFKPVVAFDVTQRGDGGFGSTGQ